MQVGEIYTTHTRTLTHTYFVVNTGVGKKILRIEKPTNLNEMTNFTKLSHRKQKTFN